MNAAVETLKLSSTSAEYTAQPDDRPKANRDTFAWDPATFAGEQISSLVRRVFFPGWPAPHNQVVFAAVEALHDITNICQRIGETLCQQVAGTVCVLDVDGTYYTQGNSANAHQQVSVETPKRLKDLAIHVANNLWLLRSSDFSVRSAQGYSGSLVRERLSDLRREFDYTVIHAPAIGASTETASLGHWADGVVLVINAQRTRRIAAQHARDVLQAADARLIGVVLAQREFPIPQGLYRRL